MFPENNYQPAHHQQSYEDPIARRNKLILIGAGIGLLAVVTISIVAKIISDHIAETSNTVQISALASCTDGIRHSDQIWLQKKTHEYVLAQLEVDGKTDLSESQYDAVIREDSCQKKEFQDDSGHAGYSAQFILDIASLGYSFQAHIDYVKEGDPNLDYADLGAPTLYCLKEDELIYDYFDCASNPMIDLVYISELDDITRITPYVDPDGRYAIQIAHSDNTKSGYTIIITYLPGTEFYENGGDVKEYRKTYRAAAEKYLTDHDQTLSDYDFFEKWK